MAAYDMVGQIALFAGAYTPRGWKRCDGSVLNIVEYRALFDIIGDTYGGNGTTTFALPNLGGRYMVCAQGVRPNLRPEAWSEILPPGEDSPVEYVQSVTYAQLMTLISGSDLVPGKQYLITDFAARWFAVNYEASTDAISTVEGSEQTGNTEPLLVVATGKSSLNSICKSAIFSDDVIFYNPDHHDYGTDPFYSFLGDIISDFKGVITRRIDTLNSVDAPFDWRNLTFRRWALNPAVWSNATAYNLGDAVVSGNFLYACIQAHTNKTPASEVTYWQKILSADLSVDSYWSISSFAFSYFIGSLRYTCPVSAAYYDYNVFGGYSVRNVTIGVGFGNNVFKQSGDYESGDFSILGGSFFNTIGSGFSRNIVGSSFYRNVIGSSFRDNSVSSQCFYNSILDSFIGNVVQPLFFSNCIGSDCAYNYFGYRFSGNRVKSGFSSNKTGYAISDVDFSGATLVYNTYCKQISKSPDGTKWLSYISNAGALTIVSHTT